MSKILNTLLIILAVALTGNAIFKKSYEDTYDIKSFATIPAQNDGRIKPLDTIARNTLLILSGKESVRIENGKISPSQWLIEVLLTPQEAHQLKVFKINHPEILSALNLNTKQKYFSYTELEPHFQEIFENSKNLDEKSKNLNTYEKAIKHLHASLTLYYNLSYSLRPSATSLSKEEYITFSNSIEPGIKALKAQQEGKPFNQEELIKFITATDNYLSLSKVAYLHLFPPVNQPSSTPWNNIGQELLDTLVTNNFNPIIFSYINLTEAYENRSPKDFNHAITVIQKAYAKKEDINLAKIETEYWFNRINPFNLGVSLYLIAFIGSIAYWGNHKKKTQSTAFWILLFAFIVHSIGLAVRIYISGRPPVTNLYSSAIFVGWGAVAIGLILEKYSKNGMPTCAAALVGLSTLLIAHYLGLTGDTLEMVRAVLNTNFWLSTHVTIVTLGYAAMFINGLYGILYIFRAHIFNQLNIQEAKNLSKLIYGTCAFALLFSFTGTMLGGIWADQSWGRFWGWDPKENGALLIVLWAAIMLHAKWDGIVKGRGLAIMAVTGTIVTSWSWFGTNMLGVGLHSYGFTDKAFKYLFAFILTQLFIIALASISKERWQKLLQFK